MIVERNIKRFIVFSEDAILNALQKISDNKSRVIFCVSETGVLEGIVTDGDFRRWLVQQRDIDLNRPVSEIANRQFVSANEDDNPEDIQELFSDKIEFVPLLDRYGHLAAVAQARGKGLNFADRAITEDSPCFVIAEIGNNHNGSLDLALRLIDLAAEAGADCAKFQMRDLESLYRNAGNANDASEDLGSQYTLDLLSRFQLAPDEMFAAFDRCRSLGLAPLCTPWDEVSVNRLEDYGIDGYKVASADLTNHDLLAALCKVGKPLICSTGMSREREILETTDFLKRQGAPYALLHCNSTYPTPFKDVNLNYMNRLMDIGDCLVGYSGHERGFQVCIAAVSRGAKIIEKHFTADKGMEGNDHKVSLLPAEFKEMVQSIRDVESALGTAEQRVLTQGELINRETLAKSLVINRALNQGEEIMAHMLEVKSPGQGLQPNRKKDIIGKLARRNLKPGDLLFESDLSQETIEPRDYRFNRPWGVPVRYHDYRKILDMVKPDILEFHLSYKDLDVNLADYFSESLDLGLVVHSPELFAGDHILDLCAPDLDYREHSIRELQRVVEMTRQLAGYFPNTPRPCIVTNMGGFSMDRPIPAKERGRLYAEMLDSLSKVNCEGVEIIPQTMPPFPWHFGGQRYHNLFMRPNEIVDFCRSHDFRVCFDVSHSKLACNHLKLSFDDFLREVGPYSAHLHIADAEGLDGEGLQVADGEINFRSMAKVLAETCPAASFIPEIWQGHKNGGEGFWVALDRLEQMEPGT